MPNKKKLKILVILIILFSNLVYADRIIFDSQQPEGDRIIIDPFTGGEIGFFSGTPGAPGIYAGAGGGRGLATSLYDVIVEVIEPPRERDIFSVIGIPLIKGKSIFRPGGVVPFQIKIINKGDFPDKDTILEYYLLNVKTKETFSRAKEQFFEIPPGEKILKRNIIVPNDADLGEWRIVVEYTVQDTIIVFDSLEVVESGFLVFLNERLLNLNLSLLLILLAIPLLITGIKKKQFQPDLKFYLGVGLLALGIFQNFVFEGLTQITLFDNFSEFFETMKGSISLKGLLIAGAVILTLSSLRIKKSVVDYKFYVGMGVLIFAMLQPNLENLSIFSDNVVVQSISSTLVSGNLLFAIIMSLSLYFIIISLLEFTKDKEIRPEFFFGFLALIVLFFGRSIKLDNIFTLDISGWQFATIIGFTIFIYFGILELSKHVIKIYEKRGV